MIHILMSDAGLEVILDATFAPVRDIKTLREKFETGEEKGDLIGFIWKKKTRPTVSGTGDSFVWLGLRKEP